VGPIAQSVEQRTFNPWVDGSSPSGPTFSFSESTFPFKSECLHSSKPNGESATKGQDLKINKVFSLLALSALLVGLNVSSVSAADVPDEQWTTTLPADVYTTPHIGFLANGIGAAPNSGDSWLLGQEADGTQVGTSNVTANYWCTGYKDPACAKVKYFKYSATLGSCTTTIIADCVSAIEAFDSSGKKLSVNNVKAFSGTQYRPYEGDVSVSMPTGGASQLVDIPGAPHAGGTQYLINVHNDGYIIVGKESFTSINLNAQIFAVKLGPAPEGTDKAFSSTAVTPGQKLGKNPGGGGLQNSNCVVYSSESKECALAYALPLDVNFKVTLKASGYVMGWFHGRVSNAAATYSLEANPADKNRKIATVALSGNPVIVPTYLAWAKKSGLATSISTFNATLEQPLQGLYLGNIDQPGGPSKVGQAPSDAKEGGVSAAKAMSVLQNAKEYNQSSIDQLNLWMAAYGDKATTNPTRWIFQSIDVTGGSADPVQMTSKQSVQPEGGPSASGGKQSPPPKDGPGAAGDKNGPPPKDGPGAAGDKKSPPPQSEQGKQPAPKGGTNEKWTACYQQNAGQLSGVVSTNATQYIAGPPTFDETSQSLDYKVAAPHLLSNGDVFQGTYNLQISNTLARCIYGFSTAPISATVSVINIDGTSKVATTVIKDSGGFLRLSAAGFTFSNPTIRVKLFQEATSSTNSKNEPPATTKAPVAKAMPKTITCLKGKLSKKVTGVTPKCPTGYILKK
jgi:hypothetical protein